MKIARPLTLFRRCFAPVLLSLTAVLAVLFVSAPQASAYLMRPAEDLEKITQEADVIFKGTVLDEAPVHDASFRALPGFAVCDTELAVVSVVKGEQIPGRLRFRHYDQEPKSGMQEYMPQFYHLEAGHTYLVFAKKTATVGVLQQIWPAHTCKQDQGVLRCADRRPTAGDTVKDVLWAELQTLLRSPALPDVLYGLQQMEEMSNGPRTNFNATKDFDRAEVIQAAGYLMRCEDPALAQAVLRIVGSCNPYMTNESADAWLRALGHGEGPVTGHWDPKMKNIGGELFGQELIALGDGPGLAATRALAIRALGRVGNPALAEPLSRWLQDPEVAVRAAATLLLADFPGVETSKRLSVLSKDPMPEVRRCAVCALAVLELGKGEKLP